MKHAQFSIACSLLFFAVANFVLSLLSLIKGIRDSKAKK